MDRSLPEKFAVGTRKGARCGTKPKKAGGQYASSKIFQIGRRCWKKFEPIYTNDNNIGGRAPAGHSRCEGWAKKPAAVSEKLPKNLEERRLELSWCTNGKLLVNESRIVPFPI
ncbi:MAG: hypothetical protein O2840_05115 [bacterium]|nr:hypothetical protein [bacterium]